MSKASVISRKQGFEVSWGKNTATVILSPDPSRCCALLGQLMRQIISQEVVPET